MQTPGPVKGNFNLLHTTPKECTEKAMKQKIESRSFRQNRSLIYCVSFCFLFRSIGGVFLTRGHLVNWGAFALIDFSNQITIYLFPVIFKRSTNTRNIWTQKRAVPPTMTSGEDASPKYINLQGNRLQVSRTKSLSYRAVLYYYNYSNAADGCSIQKYKNKTKQIYHFEISGFL